MDWQTIMGLVARHMLTYFGGVLAAHGLLGQDDASMQAFVGAGLFFVGIAWSAWQKYGKTLVDTKLAQIHGIK